MLRNNQNDDIEYLLDVQMPQPKEFISVLRGLSFRQYCSLIFFSNGLRVVVDDEIEMQVNAYFKIPFFTNYNINGSEVTLCVKLKTLLQSMEMSLDPECSARFIYKSHGDPLEILLRGTTLAAKIKVPTQPISNFLSIRCDSLNLPVKIMFSPSFLRELISDLDKSCQTAKFEFFNNKFRIETKGEIYQQTEIEMCDENSDDFLVINSVQDGVNVCFRIQNLREMIPLLRTAKRVSLRVDRNGVLSVQLMVQHGEDTITFIEFLLLHSAIPVNETTMNGIES